MLNEHPLVKLGQKHFAAPKEKVIRFVEDAEANALLNDIEHFPHIFVLACCMDSQDKAERAWMIPWLVGKELGSFDIKRLAEHSLEEYRTIFAARKLHRFYNKKDEVFYRAVHHILNHYEGDAARIWRETLSCTTVVRRFLEFHGVGLKISTMATNILAREFKIPFADYRSIDVSPDVHVKRVMGRMGLAPEKPSDSAVIYAARELCPEFPGIIDFPLWEIGRKFCPESSHDCGHCPVRTACRTGERAVTRHSH